MSILISDVNLLFEKELFYVKVELINFVREKQRVDKDLEKNILSVEFAEFATTPNFDSEAVLPVAESDGNRINHHTLTLRQTHFFFGHSVKC